MSSYTVQPIAHLHTAFPSKFGIPRQSGLVPELESLLIFCPEFRSTHALRGLEEFSHLWLIWLFSEHLNTPWRPSVRPPRLGGNRRMGVFATRSPIRPNPIGLSCVQLHHIAQHPVHGPVLHLLGADLMDGTPILDIKPYLPYAEAHPNARGGFASTAPCPQLTVIISPQLLQTVPAALHAQLYGVLAHDPRPAYHHDPHRVYGFLFAGFEIRFTVADHVLTVCSLTPANSNIAY